MDLSRFIALRIYRNAQPGKQVSRPAVLIAMIGIAIGLAVMIIAVSVIIGFNLLAPVVSLAGTGSFIC